MSIYSFVGKYGRRYAVSIGDRGEYLPLRVAVCGEKPSADDIALIRGALSLSRSVNVSFENGEHAGAFMHRLLARFDASQAPAADPAAIVDEASL